eukprot:CAMPEP_0175101406 /NCGR_PEP_ID=MMETSP0086_2-20121207/7777_1 /TAXON_ID=136419 /ORGANISM="Unknown Unknown, Strain D1" /LENGTH=60 /DNA_ID=CAMNT_0016375929 /DNA_START=367 /DNA_END=549 /DNA_ORIENTATION=-
MGSEAFCDEVDRSTGDTITRPNKPDKAEDDDQDVDIEADMEEKRKRRAERNKRDKRKKEL